VVVACQAVPFVHPALRRLARRPPLVEHGGLVSEALSGPKDLTDRYVGVCAAIRDAAAGRMPDRPQDTLEIPSMVDLAEFDPTDRAAVRREWDVADDVPVVGWVGRLDRKKRVEDVLAAAALLVPRRRPEVRWVVVGGPNFFYPEHEAVLGGRLGLPLGHGVAAAVMTLRVGGERTSILESGRRQAPMRDGAGLWRGRGWKRRGVTRTPRS